jgi:hypothetical protein
VPGGGELISQGLVPMGRPALIQVPGKFYGPDVFTEYTPRQIFEIWGEATAALGE